MVDWGVSSLAYQCTSIEATACREPACSGLLVGFLWLRFISRVSFVVCRLVAFRFYMC